MSNLPFARTIATPTLAFGYVQKVYPARCDVKLQTGSVNVSAAMVENLPLSSGRRVVLVWDDTHRRWIVLAVIKE